MAIGASIGARLEHLRARKGVSDAELAKVFGINRSTMGRILKGETEKVSSQIYDTQYSYLVFHQGNTKLIPAESVYAVFKVKQELNKEYIEYAGEKAKSVRSLHRASARIKHAGGNYDPKPLHEVLAGVLTTRSTWASPISSNVKQFLLLMF